MEQEPSSKRGVCTKHEYLAPRNESINQKTVPLPLDIGNIQNWIPDSF